MFKLTGLTSDTKQNKSKRAGKQQVKMKVANSRQKIGNMYRWKVTQINNMANQAARAQNGINRNGTALWDIAH